MTRERCLFLEAYTSMQVGSILHDVTYRGARVSALCASISAPFNQDGLATRRRAVWAARKMPEVGEKSYRKFSGEDPKTNDKSIERGAKLAMLLDAFI
jgi:hypothetical protein